MSRLALLLILGCPPVQTEPEQTQDLGQDGGDGGDGGGDGGGQDSGDTGAEDPPGQLRINEFMASNRSTVSHPGGVFADWIELHNGTDARIDLTGWRLREDPDSDGIMLEDLAIPAGGYLVLWADNASGLGPDHLSFALAKEGGWLGLSDPFGVMVDQVSWPQQATDVAAMRLPDGAERWDLQAAATPGAANPAPTPVGDEGDPAAEGLCTLGSDLDGPWFLEGDTVEVQVACTGDLATEDAVIAVVRAPSGAEGEGDALSWTSGPADGGRVELVFSARPRGITDQVPEAGTVTVWVADNPDAPDNVPVDPATYTEEWGLPVYHLDPVGTVGQSYVDATLTYMGKTYATEMKVRGASSAGYPKQSYTLDFDDEELEVEGWQSRDHMVLVTTFDDNSYVRQKLVYDLWAAMSAFSGEQRLVPRSYFATVYLSGEYYGLYMAIDHIDDEFVRHMGWAGEGNMYKAVNHNANFYLTNSSGIAKTVLYDGYEKKEGEPEHDWSDLEDLVEFTGNASAATLVDEAYQWMALDEFMDWLLLVHYSAANDSAGKNSYLYNEDPAFPNFHYVPWDFNHAWGQNWYTARQSASEVSTFTSRNRVFWALEADETASAALWAHYADLRANGPLHPDWLTGTVDDYYALIQPSCERDWAKWGDAYRSYGSWSSRRDSADDWQDFEGERQYLYDWLDDRSDVMDEQHP